MKIIVDGRTSQSFKKLITSAPIFGTTRLSLIERSAPKLNNTQSIINANGANNLISDLSIGQKISFNLALKEEFLKLDIYSFLKLLKTVLTRRVNT